MHEIFENILIMMLTIVILVTGAYLVLLLLGWGLKLRSGSREQQGLTDLLIASQTDALRNKPENAPEKEPEHEPPDRKP